MKQADAKKYIKKLGLEKGHNGLRRVEGNPTLDFKTENELARFASKMIYDLVHADFATGMDYRVTMYILRADGTAQYCFNDAHGIYPSSRLPLHVVKERANSFAKYEDYILLVETKKNCFEPVSQI